MPSSNKSTNFPCCHKSNCRCRCLASFFRLLDLLDFCSIKIWNTVMAFMLICSIGPPSAKAWKRRASSFTFHFVGASLSEPLLAASMAALSIYIYNIYVWWYVRQCFVRTSFRKCSTSRFMRMMLFRNSVSVPRLDLCQ